MGSDRPATTQAQREDKQKLPLIGHVACGWPLLMVLFGGAIGGGLGGLAYGINVGIYKSTLPLPAKVVPNITAGTAAFLLWFVVAAAIELWRLN
jgi:hypothetical protein